MPRYAPGGFSNHGWLASFGGLDPFVRFQALALSTGIVEAIGGEVTKESKVRDNCDNYDVRSI